MVDHHADVEIKNEKGVSAIELYTQWKADQAASSAGHEHAAAGSKGKAAEEGDEGDGDTDMKEGQQQQAPPQSDPDAKVTHVHYMIYMIHNT